MILLPLFLGSALAAPSVEAPLPAVTPVVTSLSSLSTALLQDEPEEVEEGVWHGSINLGMSKAEGNVNIETYALTGKAVRVVDIHRYTLDGLWYYSTLDNEINQRRALGSAKYDQFFSEKTYFWTNVLGETNEQAELDLRWTVGGGIGQQWRDDPEWKINTEVGLAYFKEEFNSGEKNDYLAARLAWDVWKRLTDTVVFGHFAEIFPSVEDADDIYGRGETYVEAQLSARMTARLSWIAVYDNTPAELAPGVNLKRLDNIYLLNLGWTF
ncbi:MAG: putative salt-induced outer membrane protein YdiY [Planctomycetota bacterium]|jgi:putative salt-induced outer membrane protein YdiY